MFDTLSQFCTFVACISFGVGSGIFVSVSTLLKKTVKTSFVKIILDVFFFFVIAVLYVLYAYRLGFSSLRVYMLFGVFAGITAYMKTFHIFVAKFIKKGYNRLQLEKDKRRCKYERRKNKKSNRCNDGGRRFVARRSSCRYGVSTDFDKRSTKKRKKTRRTDSNLQGT